MPITVLDKIEFQTIPALERSAKQLDEAKDAKAQAMHAISLVNRFRLPPGSDADSWSQVNACLERLERVIARADLSLESGSA